MIILFKKMTALTMSAILIASSMTLTQNNGSELTVIKSAASDVSVHIVENAKKPVKVKKAKQNNIRISKNARVPVVSLGAVHSDRINLKINNIKLFKDDTKIEINCGGKTVKRVAVNKIRIHGNICVESDGINYLKPKKKYSFTVRTVNASNTAASASRKITAATADKTYYKIDNGAVIYAKKGGRLVSTKKRVSGIQYVTGKQTFSDGSAIAGKKLRGSSRFVYIKTGKYKGCYVSLKRAVRTSERNVKINKVINYAVGMNGGNYVFGGERYRATDCSGLTMLSYRQVGVNMPHYAASQAGYGKANSVKNIKPGDVIICNWGSHAALYIGKGKIIHAMSPYYGIRIQHISDLRYVGAITSVRTII